MSFYFPFQVFISLYLYFYYIYYICFKGFMSSSNQYNMPSHQQASSFTSMPVKWSPSGQPQQQQQPQQQHQYEPEYTQSTTPRPNPQEIYQRSLAQSRNEQNEYLAEMQRSKYLF